MFEHVGSLLIGLYFTCVVCYCLFRWTAVYFWPVPALLVTQSPPSARQESWKILQAVLFLLSSYTVFLGADWSAESGLATKAIIVGTIAVCVSFGTTALAASVEAALVQYWQRKRARGRAGPLKTTARDHSRLG